MLHVVRSIVVVSLVWLAVAVARAQENAVATQPEDAALRVQERLVAAGAGPNAPSLTVGWRGAMHASVGLPLTLYVARPGWFVRLLPMIELHDFSTFNAFPFEHWRGVLGLDLGVREAMQLDQGPRLVLSLSGSLDHESDHETVSVVDPMGSPVARYDSFLFTNALTLHGGLAAVWPEVSIAAELAVSAHVASCTRTGAMCAWDLLTQGQTLSSALDVVVRTGEAGDVDRFQLCGAVHGAVVAPTERIAEELRVQAQVGPCIRFRELGEWSLVGQVGIGSLVGMQREEQSVRGGAALRWIPKG